MMMNSIKLKNGTEVHTGDCIIAEITCSDEAVLIENAKLYVDESSRDEDSVLCYICQNEYDGAESPHRLGYEYSWQVRINTKTGNIESSDTYYIKLKEPVDDDPMPDGWVCDEEIPQDL